MRIEEKIHLNKFQMRPYQIPIADALENKSYKKIIAVMPRRCLSGDTHIIMANGSYKLLKDLQVGDEILSWDGDSFVHDKVKNIWQTDIKDTITLQSPGKLPIVTSYDHLFACSYDDRESVNWKKASEFGSRAKLLQYAGSSFGSINNPDLAEFYGYMLADGYVSHYQQPKFTNINLDILKRVEELAIKLFGVKVIWRKKGNAYDLGLSNGTLGGGYTINPIKELFRKDNLDIPKSKKRLPPILWEMDEQSIGRYFAGLISADGNIYLHKNGYTFQDRKIPPAVDINIHCGQSYELAYDIYWLLRKMGILVRVPIKERGRNWKLCISKGEDIKKLLSFGPIYGKQDRQAKMLEAVKNTKRKAIPWRGCFRSLCKRIKSNPEHLFDIETERHHNFVANGYLVHNSGKDLLCWNLMIRQALKRIGVYYYMFPTYAQAKKVIWQSSTNSGIRFIDFIPPTLIESSNSQDMSIRLVNGSLIQLIGSDNIDAIVGTNPIGVIYSEAALQDPRAYQFIRPILAANLGFAIFISTPRGKNWFYELFQIAKNSPDWFAYHLTLNDTEHIPLHEIEREHAEGIMSEDLIQQEYYCSWDMGVEGSYYSRYIDRMRVHGRLGDVPWESGFKVHTAWDLGMRDSTMIIFFQTIGATVRIIDCYENAGYGLDHYIKVLQQKPYAYGKHIAPHDIKVRELGTGQSRLEKARTMGLTFTVAPDLSIEDGIESVRATMSKMWIDQNNCAPLIKALENYRHEYDPRKKSYKKIPLHDWSSHFSDCLRYLCISLPKTKDGATPEDIERNYREALGGNQNHLPYIFRTDLPDY